MEKFDCYLIPSFFFVCILGSVFTLYKLCHWIAQKKVAPHHNEHDTFNRVSRTAIFSNCFVTLIIFQKRIKRTKKHKAQTNKNKMTKIESVFVALQAMRLQGSMNCRKKMNRINETISLSATVYYILCYIFRAA